MLGRVREGGKGEFDGGLKVICGVVWDVDDGQLDSILGYELLLLGEAVWM